MKLLNADAYAGWCNDYTATCIAALCLIMQIMVIHRIAWRRTFSSAFCDASTVSAGSLIGPSGSFTCRDGCSDSLGSVQYQCTDFSVSEDWSAGEGSNEINLSGVTTFEASWVTQYLNLLLLFVDCDTILVAGVCYCMILCLDQVAADSNNEYMQLPYNTHLGSLQKVSMLVMLFPAISFNYPYVSYLHLK